ncbi:MAG: putative glycoside hydrolase [Patescibacteria group bacterium]
MKLITGIITTLIFVCAGTFAFDYYSQKYSFSFPNTASAIEIPKASTTATTTEIIPEPVPVVDTHMKTPDAVRGIYVSAYSFMDKNFQKKLDTMIDNTTVNAIVVDIKDAPGTILFDIGLDTPCVNPLLSRSDLESRLQYYKNKGIYTIARIAVFRDACFTKLHPDLAVQSTDGTPWRDFKGNYWLSPHEMQTKEYIRDMARVLRKKI